VDYAKTSAIIETRLGHLLEKDKTHEIDYLEIRE